MTRMLNTGRLRWGRGCRQHALTAEQNLLMRSSSGLGKKETKKQALKRALQLERAGACSSQAEATLGFHDWWS
jgi:hypothetical protein